MQTEERQEANEKRKTFDMQEIQKNNYKDHDNKPVKNICHQNQIQH